MLSAAAAYRLSGTQVWEVFPRQGADVLYDFDYSQAGGPTVIEELAYRLAQARHKYARCTRNRQAAFAARYNAAQPAVECIYSLSQKSMPKVMSTSHHGGYVRAIRQNVAGKKSSYYDRMQVACSSLSGRTHHRRTRLTERHGDFKRTRVLLCRLTALKRHTPTPVHAQTSRQFLQYRARSW